MCPANRKVSGVVGVEGGIMFAVIDTFWKGRTKAGTVVSMHRTESSAQKALKRARKSYNIGFPQVVKVSRRIAPREWVMHGDVVEVVTA